MRLEGTLTFTGTVTEAAKIPDDVAVIGAIIGPLNSGDLTIEVSPDGSSFTDLYESDGTEWKLASTVGNIALLIPALAGFSYFRFANSASQTGKTIDIFGR